MKVLVTGGQGFIGGYVVQKLYDNGHTPVIFDRYLRDEEGPLVDDFFIGDVIDPAACTEAMAHVDAFIHLAAVLGTQETINNPVPAAHTNILGGLNILDAASQYGVPGTYIGVGNHWMNNTYSITKTTIERFIDMYNKHRDTDINIVRAMNAYGPRQVPASPYGPAKVRKITPSFCCRAIKGDDIEIYGDGEQVSDMVWVGDVADALVRSMMYAAEGVVMKPIEVGPADNNTVNDVANLIIELTGSDSKIVHLPMRPGEIPNSTVCADVSMMNKIGMNPDTMKPLLEGMEETVKYYQEYFGAST
jgi:nucleoside-diphosphate-sugar epimerase